MTFFLGTHRPNWLGLTDVPLFVSRRTLAGRKTLPVAQGAWALDSGGFTELSMFGHYRTGRLEYEREVVRFGDEVGRLEWVAPQDWMCEPFMLAKTGGSVEVHQRLTVESFVGLRDRLGSLVIPVLQGWSVDDYLYCAAVYEEEYGVDLAAEAVVGVGSVCRRQGTVEAGRIFERLASDGLRLHGFGVKVDGLKTYGDCLVSADSMAWSYRARRSGPCSCGRRSGANCLHYALGWRETLLDTLPLRLWEDATCAA